MLMKQQGQEQLEQQHPLNASKQCDNLLLHSYYNMNLTVKSLPTTNVAALANSNATKKLPGKVNFYDPIQQHSSDIPHLNTSSGDKYALQSPDR